MQGTPAARLKHQYHCINLSVNTIQIQELRAGSLSKKIRLQSDKMKKKNLFPANDTFTYAQFCPSMPTNHIKIKLKSIL